MRILHLTRDFPPRHAGGLSTAVGALVAAARNSRHGHHAVVSFDGWRPSRGRDGSPPRTPPDPTTPEPILRVEGPDDLPAVESFARAWMPSAIHVHHAMLGDMGADLATTLGIPLLATAHVLQFQLSTLRDVTEPTLSDAAETRLLQRATSISAPTRAAASKLAAHMGIVDATIALTRLGAPFVARKAHPPDTTAHLVSIGRFDPLKGTDTLLAAIPDILATHPDLRVTVLGGVPENQRADRRWRERFNTTCMAFAPRFRILPWSGPDAVAELMRAATHLVAPSRAETCGLTVLEALSHGLAVIASDIAPHREIAPAADFFDPDMPTALVAAIDHALARPSRHSAPRPPTWPEVLPDWVHFWEKWR